MHLLGDLFEFSVVLFFDESQLQFYQVTNSMNDNSGEVNNFSADQEIPHL